MNLIPGSSASDDKKVLEQVAYQTALYLPLSDKNVEIKDGDSIVEIIDIVQTAMNDGTITDEKKREEYEGYISELSDIVDAHPEIGTAVISNPSWSNAEKYDPEGFRACTFSRNGQLNVCFRGTPEGAWIDNGLAMTGVVDAEYLEAYECDSTVINMSAMQLCAVKYIEEAIADKKKNLPMCVSGHSKGGNFVNWCWAVAAKMVGMEDCRSRDRIDEGKEDIAMSRSTQRRKPGWWIYIVPVYPNK